ncbi:MAG: hypothetical protein ABIH34_07750 [Nanoarchaeota archaeon]
MKLWQLSIFLLAIAIAIFSLGLYWYTNIRIVERQYVGIEMHVDDHIGFNLDTDKIHIGRVTSPGSSKRGITISHEKPYPLWATMSIAGNITPFIAIDPPRVLVPPDNKTTVTFYAAVPEDVPFGNYSGTAQILFTRWY